MFFPSIPVTASAVRVLHSPPDFYTLLLHSIRNAKTRVFLSSLYIGENALIDALDDALSKNSRLQLHIVLDYNRTTRPGPDAPVRALVPLLRHGSRVRLSLFRSPNVMSSLAPPRFNEGWGTWHPKIYGADDDVIITGANLNSSYFTNRQDRYFHFKAQPLLADYCSSFLRTIAPFSFHLLQTVIQRPDQPCSDVHTALANFQAAHRTPSPASADTVIYPLIQAGQFNIREEERAIAALFRHLPSYPAPVLAWTSGYFGLYRPYRDLILDSNAACDVIAASPQANGFYGSRGLSGLIPEGYTLLEQRFMRAVRAARRLPDQSDHPVTLSEWARQGWTYHAKGIWLSPSRDRPPVATMFGSTNLNSRSANLDTELSFLMVTSSQALQQALHDEVRHLRRWATPWRGADRTVRWRTRAIVGLVGHML